MLVLDDSSGLHSLNFVEHPEWQRDAIELHRKSTIRIVRHLDFLAYSGDRGQQFQAIVGTSSTASWAGFMPIVV